MANQKFGEGFPKQFNDENRLSPYKEKQKEYPEYLQTALAAREALKASIETKGWPEKPEITSAEGFFQSAKDAVSDRWNSEVVELLGQRCEDWLSSIPDNEETQTIRQVLSDPSVLEEKLRIQQFGVLEGLRQYVPEAWKTLLLLSSERQMAAIATARIWSREMDETETKKLGMNKAELQIFLDLASIFGKYIDMAFVRQTELADLPGGSAATPLAGNKGAKFLYDLPRVHEGETSIDIKTYSDVFPFEWPRIVSRLQAVAENIRQQTDSNILPKEYKGLAKHLDIIAIAYGSESITPQEVYDLYNEIFTHTQQLSETSIPAMVIAQNCPSVAGDADKVDTEIRLGLRTPETRSMEQVAEEIVSRAQKIIDSFNDSLSEAKTVPRVILNIQPFAFGPNLFWMTRGESTRATILSHADAVKDVARVGEIPSLEKILSSEINKEKYLEASVMATILHEVGHFVPPKSDEKVKRRVGTGAEQTFLEELKAWTVGTKLFTEGEPTEKVDRPDALLGILGVHLDYLKNKSDREGSSGERYYLCGVAVVSTLLEEEVLQKQGSKYTITDPEKGLAAIAKIGDKILALYTADDATPEKSVDFVNDVKKKKEDPQFKELLQLLKAV